MCSETGIFSYAEVGKYTIRVTDKKVNTASEVVSVKRMNVFDVYITGEGNLVLRKDFNVSGTVSPSLAKVMISDTKGNIIETVYTIDGAFEFESIPRGTYIVKALNETGSGINEIHVSDEDLAGVNIEIQEDSAMISGVTKIGKHDGTYVLEDFRC